MLLDLTAEVEGQFLEDLFLLDASSGEPVVLNEAADAVLEIWRELAVAHPLLGVSPLHSPFFESCCCRLQIRLSNQPTKTI